jgi:hypothetical protein
MAICKITGNFLVLLLFAGALHGLNAEQPNKIGAAQVSFPSGWEISRKGDSNEVLIAKAPETDIDRRILISVTEVKARYQIDIAKATGSELGSRMMQNRANGWLLRTRGTLTTALGLPVGRFDYQAGQPPLFQSYLLVQVGRERFLEIEVFTRIPFSRWDKIDVLISDLLDSISVDNSQR